MSLSVCIHRFVKHSFYSAAFDSVEPSVHDLDLSALFFTGYPAFEYVFHSVLRGFFVCQLAGKIRSGIWTCSGTR